MRGFNLRQTFVSVHFYELYTMLSNGNLGDKFTYGGYIQRSYFKLTKFHYKVIPSVTTNNYLRLNYKGYHTCAL